MSVVAVFNITVETFEEIGTELSWSKGNFQEAIIHPESIQSLFKMRNTVMARHALV